MNSPPSGITACAQTNSVRPKPGFDVLCQLAREIFAVPAATLVLTNGESWIACEDSLASRIRDVAIHQDPFRDSDDTVAIVEEAPQALSDLSGSAILPEPRSMASSRLGGGRGRLSLFDVVPRQFSAEERTRLHHLARLADQLLYWREEAERARDAEAGFRLLAETSTDTIVRGNLDGIRLYISPSVRTLLGYEPEELVGRKAIDIVHPDDVTTFRGLMQQIRAGELTVGTSEIRQQHKNGSWVWMEASVRLTHDEATGSPNGYVASVRASGHRKEMELRLAHLATHDGLTGLPNRVLFNTRMDRAIAGLHERGEGFAVLCIDMDRFKLVNDTFGHQAGDAVLCEAARRFRAAVRVSDTVARLGGDEFAVLMNPSRGPADTIDLARRLIDAMAEPFGIGGHVVPMGVSIGIAHAPLDGGDADALVSAADRALYEAKVSGRNAFRLVHPPDGTKIPEGAQDLVPPDRMGADTPFGSGLMPG